MTADGVGHLFATPVGRFLFPRATDVNPGLRAAILGAAEQYPSAGRSNVGGWHSRPDLFRWAVPEVDELVAWLMTRVSAVIEATAGPVRFRGELSAVGWASVCRPGDYNAPHTHPGAAWSGVYYVDAGDPDPNRPLAGRLELLDPRGAAGAALAPGDPFGDPVRIAPEAGLLVLFPGWLAHWVHPHADTRARVAVSFNVTAAGD